MEAVDLAADVEKVEYDDDEVRDGSVTLLGHPATRSKTGGWKAGIFFQGLIAVYGFIVDGIGSNLIPYLITTLQITSINETANIVNNFSGISFLLSVVWGFVADTTLGRYVTLIISCLFTAAGLFVMTLSAILTEPNMAKCGDEHTCKPSATQLNLFYAGLYMVAISSAGVGPCAGSMGRDQFEEGHPTEDSQGKEFFKFLYVNLNIGALLASSIGYYVQATFGYDWGWGAIAVLFVVSSVAFLFGTRLYRHQPPEGSVLTGIFQVIAVALKNSRKPIPTPENLYEVDDSVYKSRKKSKLGRTERLRFLEKAAIKLEQNPLEPKIPSSWKVCTVTQVEELKSLVQIFPIWLCCILVFTLFSLAATVSVATAFTMDRRVGKLVIPAGSAMFFLTSGTLTFFLVYEYLIVPVARKITGNPNGLSELQQMGAAIFISIISMSVAVLVERKRVQTIKAHFQPSDYDDLTRGIQIIPMSILWLWPQYTLLGAVDYLFGVAIMNFFYSETPESMRGIAASIYLVSISLGYFTSTAIVRGVNAATYKASDNGGWLSGLQVFQGGLEYFYCLFIVILTIDLGFFVLFSYIYQRKVVQRGHLQIIVEKESKIGDLHKQQQLAGTAKAKALDLESSDHTM